MPRAGRHEVDAEPAGRCAYVVVDTPRRRSSLTQAWPNALSGTTLTMDVACPMQASDTATFASAPPTHTRRLAGLEQQFVVRCIQPEQQLAKADDFGSH